MSEQEAFEKHMLKTYGERWQEFGYPPHEIIGVWQACAERKDKEHKELLLKMGKDLRVDLVLLAISYG